VINLSEIKRKYVIPGELIAQGSYGIRGNMLKIGDKIYATRIGMAEVSTDTIRLISLNGSYMPRLDDLVVGKVVNFNAFGWQVDIESWFPAFLPAANVMGRDYSSARDSLASQLTIGDQLLAAIAGYDRTRDPMLSISGPGLGKIAEGNTIKVSPSKVPRIIGKKGAMVNAIESGSGCRLSIGQNGIIVMVGSADSVSKATSAINLIESEAHSPGLTQKVHDILSLGDKS